MIHCALVILLPVLTHSLFITKRCQFEDGMCRLISDCKPLMDELTANFDNPRRRAELLNQHKNCGFEGTNPMVCCQNLQTSTETEKLNTRNKGVDHAKNIQKIEDHRNLRFLPTRCGEASSKTRIVGGNTTSPFEIPWMALLSYSTRIGNKFRCGGSIISERYVLTAAHCVLNELKLNGVIIGEHDIRTNPDCEEIKKGVRRCAPSAKNFTIEKIIEHPYYTKKLSVNDIALLRLSEPINFTQANVKPICLPTTRELQTESLDDVESLVTGWGFMNETHTSPVLLKVQLPILSEIACQAAYKSPFSKTQLCAGLGDGKDSCKGDSGGPLVNMGRLSSGLRRYVQRGIVVLGPIRCGFGLPGIYTRVGSYMDWILENIEE